MLPVKAACFASDSSRVNSFERRQRIALFGRREPIKPIEPIGLQQVANVTTIAGEVMATSWIWRVSARKRS